MELALSLGKSAVSLPPPTKTATQNFNLGLWFSTDSSLKSHNPTTSYDPPLQLGLPWSNETTTMELPGSRETTMQGSDDEQTGLSSPRKKLRLSKEQAVYLEESFKNHQTLTPKQKVALAKVLRLRPRQVEVWFQNRRARTKLKQTGVDCSYFKRSSDVLTAENRRLEKEISEIRALNAVQPFYMQFPTTLSMCPNCERITAVGGSCAALTNHRKALFASLLNKPGFFPFAGYAATSHPPSAA